MAKLYSYSRFVIPFLVLIFYQNCGEISLISRASIACEKEDASCNPIVDVVLPKSWDFPIDSGLCEASVDQNLAVAICSNYNNQYGVTLLAYEFDGENWVKGDEELVCTTTSNYICTANFSYIKKGVIALNHSNVQNGNAVYLKTVVYEYNNGAWREQPNPLVSGNVGTIVSKGSSQWGVSLVYQEGFRVEKYENNAWSRVTTINNASLGTGTTYSFDNGWFLLDGDALVIISRNQSAIPNVLTALVFDLKNPTAIQQVINLNSFNTYTTFSGYNPSLSTLTENKLIIKTDVYVSGAPVEAKFLLFERGTEAGTFTYKGAKQAPFSHGMDGFTVRSWAIQGDYVLHSDYHAKTVETYWGLGSSTELQVVSSVPANSFYDCPIAGYHVVRYSQSGNTLLTSDLCEVGPSIRNRIRLTRNYNLQL